MRASVESLAPAVTLYSKEPVSLMVPAKTWSPSAFSTGRLSPVMGAWLMADRPEVIRPSSAMRSPGRTRTTAPFATSLAGSSVHEPSACRTVAVSGAKSISPRMALRARSSDFASITSANANRNMTMAASGQWPIAMPPVTAMAIRAFMFRLRFFSAIQPFL